MSWLDAIIRRKPALDAAQSATLDAYRRLPLPDLDAPFTAQRVLVVDVEASGLDPFHDRLISIGAIGVRAGLARHVDAFEVVLRQDRPSKNENILVHGIGGSAQLAGRETADGLLEFLSIAGKTPLVAFHADFDRVLIERAAAAALGRKPENLWLDLALLAPALCAERAGAATSLDDWLQAFGIANHERHNALADALATAQLLLVVLAAASQRGLGTWAQLARLQEDQRWLVRAGRSV